MRLGRADAMDCVPNLPAFWRVARVLSPHHERQRCHANRRTRPSSGADSRGSGVIRGTRRLSMYSQHPMCCSSIHCMHRGGVARTCGISCSISAPHSPTLNSGVRPISSPRATMSLADGKAAAPTPGQRSTIFSSAHTAGGIRSEDAFYGNDRAARRESHDRRGSRPRRRRHRAHAALHLKSRLTGDEGWIGDRSPIQFPSSRVHFRADGPSTP
jgi:hypothetical protein